MRDCNAKQAVERTNNSTDDETLIRFVKQATRVGQVVDLLHHGISK